MAQAKLYPNWKELSVVGSDGPTHQTLIEAQGYKAVLVSLGAGKEIPPHPAAAAAYHFLEGSGWMIVKGERLAVAPGATVVVPAGVPRGVEAETKLSFLGSHGVSQKEDPRPAMKMGLPLILGALLMLFLMAALMILPAQMMPRMAGLGLGMWGVMLVPLIGVAAMLVVMVFAYRRMAGTGGGPAMMHGHTRAHAQTSQANQNSGTLLTFDVPSVNCGHCKLTIERAVGQIQGVETVRVDVDAKQAVVKFDPPATRAEIETVLAEIGYPPAP